MKTCPSCKTDKAFSEFHKNSRMKDKLQCQCKACHSTCRKEWRSNNNERNAAHQRNWYANPNNDGLALSNQKRKKHEATKLRAVPIWFERDLVNEVYRKAQEFGFAVDHIVPLQSPNVCGLHCWANLQLLDSQINCSKGNRYWPDMAHETTLGP
jgi:hypothetical protein